MDLLTEKNKGKYLEFLDMNKQKFFMRRLIYSAILIAVAIIVLVFGGYLSNDIKYLLFIPLAGIIGYKFPYIELLNTMSRVGYLKYIMFPEFLRFFISFLPVEGNVYQALKRTTEYLEFPIKKEVGKLTKKLEKDSANSHMAFLEFANFIDSSEARLIMNTLSQFNEEGINRIGILELESMVNELNNNRIDELVTHKIGKLNKYADPIIISVFAFIIGFVVVIFMDGFQSFNSF